MRRQWIGTSSPPQEVTQLRSQWAGAATSVGKAQAASHLEGAIRRLLLVAEQYPDLRASVTFRDLQVQLEGTENRIAVERQRYNDALRAYNTKIRQVPGTLIAARCGFQPSSAYFEAVPAAKGPPEVDFRTNR